MAEHRALGDILKGFGRITEDDVEKALAYQQENGGYFGEALLALGLLSSEEVDWGLAAQFDLPYVFPEAENIDPDAAALVTPEWALTHLTLPIMRTADTLTVVVDSPIKTEAVEQLRARTDRTIDLALAPATKIRELIRKVYGRPETPEAGRPAATLDDLLASGAEAGAERFGLSVRGPWVHGWYDEGGTVHRLAVQGDWRNALERVLSPGLDEAPAQGLAESWTARLVRGGLASTVEVRHLATGLGSELVFEVKPDPGGLLDRFSTPPTAVVSEIRLLAGTGAGRVAVTGDPESLADGFFPHLPALLFDTSWRSVHLADAGRGAPEDVFAVEVPADPDARVRSLESVRAFRFDVATADLGGDPGEWAEAATDTAAVGLVRWRELHDRTRAAEAGIRWELRLSGPSALQAEWTLTPIDG